MTEITILGTSSVQWVARTFSVAAQMLPQHIQSAILESTLLVKRDVKERTPVRTDTLRGSIYSEVRPFQGIVSTNHAKAPYDTAVEYGAKPHAITPKKGKYLVFQGSGGSPVFVQKVKHPGFKGRKMFTRAREQMGKTVRAVFEKWAAKAVNQIGR
jgi:hypothetical protein